MPALTPRVTACMRSRLWVHTAAARPYSVALARWMTCSMRGGPALWVATSTPGWAVNLLEPEHSLWCWVLQMTCRR